MISIIFFGSFQSYSVQVLQKLVDQPDFKVTAAITTPPRPGDRGQITKTAVHEFCETHNIPVYPLENLNSIPTDLEKPDFIIVAGYGKLIPLSWLSFAKICPINLHPSLLPKYPGRFPIEWAILQGEAEAGVSLIQMTEKFDQGEILAQESIPLQNTDTKENLYFKLFDLGAALIIQILYGQPLPARRSGWSPSFPKPTYQTNHTSLRASAKQSRVDRHGLRPRDDAHKHFYARQLTREDGFIPWEFFLDQNSKNIPNLFKDIPNKNTILDKMLRALHPWPGVWTLTPQGKRLKILSLNPLTVQPEGKNSVLWEQIKGNF